MHPSNELLERYIVGRVSAEEAAEIDEHVSSCPRCQGLLVHTEGFQSIERAITKSE